MASPSTALIVVNHRSADLTAQLVDAVAGEVDEVVVVDNPSDAGSDVPALEALAARHEHVRVAAMDRNVGYGAGMNAGAALTDADVLVIANPDVVPEPGAIATLVDAARGVGAAGPRFHNPDGTLQRSAHHRDPGLLVTAFDFCPPVSGVVARLKPGWHPTVDAEADHDHPHDAHHLLGAFFAVDGAAFRALGGFDEWFFLYREETDLFRRLRDAGWRVRFEPGAVAVHASGGSTVDAWPLVARPVMLESHYHFIAKHQGRAIAALARVLGTIGAAVWVLRMKDGRSARRSLRWHLTGRPRARV